jgi:uncharacterized DUF497 family protein
MEFEWDPEKADRNQRKHGVDFADAVLALFDPLAITILDDEYCESRYITMGVDGLGRLLVLVYTMRRASIRLISARKADRFEQRNYEELP